MCGEMCSDSFYSVGKMINASVEKLTKELEGVLEQRTLIHSWLKNKIKMTSRTVRRGSLSFEVKHSQPITD